jgi:SagB-type dehydrogenase family enzyme
MSSPSAFRDNQPAAWTYHRVTARSSSSVEIGEAPACAPGREQPTAPWIALPDGDIPSIALCDAITSRLCCRTFCADSIALTDLGAVLRAGYGLLSYSSDGATALPERAVPSAGGLYPLEVSILVRAVDGLAAGVHHYVPTVGGLEVIRSIELPGSFITYLFMGQRWVADAALVIVLSAVTERSLAKYQDRGYRYLLLEAGHVMQNVNLVAAGLGLGAVDVGGFFDDELANLIGADPEYEIPLYACAVGVPATPPNENRIAIRALPDQLQPPY